MSKDLNRRRFLATASVAAGGVLISNARAATQPTSGLRIRKEVGILEQDPAALAKLRNAFRELQATGGPNGYQKIAGYHGEPDHYCHQDDTIFLPWHRAYILALEDALQAIDPTVTLPFWDWTSSNSIQKGIPSSYADKIYDDGGTERPNPLYAAKIDLLGRNTRRRPRPSVALGGLVSQVASAFSKTSFLVFSASLEFPHGGLHTWVRGDMGSTPYAAYDPIFWLHHSNVDRQWAQWQLGPNNDEPSASILNKDLKPFGMKVTDVINYKMQLNYDYEGIKPMPPQTIFLTDKGSLLELTDFEFNPTNEAVFLFVHDVRPSAESFNVDVFIEQPDATDKTSLEGNLHYAGSFGIFGLGKQHTHPGVKNTHRVLNLTPTATKFAKPREKTKLSIKLVVTDMDGKPVDIRKLPIKGFSIQKD